MIYKQDHSLVNHILAIIHKEKEETHILARKPKYCLWLIIIDILLILKGIKNGMRFINKNLLLL